MAKAEVYKWVKIGGILSFIPFVLVAGPLGGYFLGDYLEKKFGLGSYVSLICITIGFLVSVRETIRIVKMALRTEEDR